MEEERSGVKIDLWIALKGFFYLFLLHGNLFIWYKKLTSLFDNLNEVECNLNLHSSTKQLRELLKCPLWIFALVLGVYWIIFSEET